jgi:hypothetical protein
MRESKETLNIIHWTDSLANTRAQNEGTGEPLNIVYWTD